MRLPILIHAPSIVISTSLDLAVLAERPTEGIAAWSAALFASPDLKEQVERHTAAMAAAATAAAGASESEPDAKPPAGP